MERLEWYKWNLSLSKLNKEYFKYLISAKSSMNEPFSHRKGYLLSLINLIQYLMY